MCRSARTPAPPAARGPAPRVPHLGLHRPAQLGAAHHPHGGPGLPRHGPQQDTHHWQDQVRRKRVWPTPPRRAIYGTPQISLSSALVIEMTATCKHLKSRTASPLQASFFRSRNVAAHTVKTDPANSCLCRLRVNCVGVFDVLTFDNSQTNHLALMPQYQVARGNALVPHWLGASARRRLRVLVSCFRSKQT